MSPPFADEDEDRYHDQCDEPDYEPNKIFGREVGDEDP